jgi:hypothetical protein
VAQAQQPEQMRRIGVLLSAAADDSEYPSLVGPLLEGAADGVIKGALVGDPNHYSLGTLVRLSQPGTVPFTAQATAA